MRIKSLDISFRNNVVAGEAVTLAECGFGTVLHTWEKEHVRLCGMACDWSQPVYCHCNSMSGVNVSDPSHLRREQCASEPPCWSP